MNPAFFVPVLLVVMTATIATAMGQDCRKELAQKVCLTDEYSSQPPTDHCGEETVASKAILAAFDEFPDFLKAEVCKLDRIFVPAHARFTGLTTGSVGADGKVSKVVVFLNGELLSKTLTWSQFLTWKEQLSFGGSQEPGVTRQDLASYSGWSLRGSDSFVPFIFAHEMGHVLDLKYGVYERWAPFSWNMNPTGLDTPLPSNEFPHRQGACFYQCSGKFIEASSSTEYYQGLNQSSFVDGYAATDPVEDFAETFAFFVMDRSKGAELSLALPGGDRIDLMARFRSQKFADKTSFVARLVRELSGIQIVSGGWLEDLSLKPLIQEKVQTFDPSRIAASLQAMQSLSEYPNVAEADPASFHVSSDALPEVLLDKFRILNHVAFGRQDVLQLKPTPEADGYGGALCVPSQKTVFISPRFVEEQSKDVRGSHFLDFVVAHEVSHYVYELAVDRSEDHRSPAGNRSLLGAIAQENRDLGKRQIADPLLMQDPSFTRQYYENMIDAAVAHAEVDSFALYLLRALKMDRGDALATIIATHEEQKDQLAFARSMPGGFMRALAYDGLDDTDLIRIGAMNGAVESWAK